MATAEPSPNKSSLPPIKAAATKSEWPSEQSLLLVLTLICIYLISCSIDGVRWASASPNQSFCEVISSQDSYYLCQVQDRHAECQKSMVTFNLTLGEKTWIRLEEIVFQPRLSKPVSGKIECYYRWDDIENSLFLNHYRVPTRDGKVILYVISTTVLLLAIPFLIFFLLEPFCRTA